MAPEEEILDRVHETVERFVSARSDVDGEDIVQEAMTRLLENRTRLEPDAWASYAVVSAGNILLDLKREGDVRRRHAHRLHAPDVSASPEDSALTDEEHSALRQAMESLDAPTAAVLQEHYARSEPPGRSVGPAAAARLARARAKLRVAYVLAHTGVPLPSRRCRPVLEAVSSGERRRQERVGAGRHLLACRVCACYAPALVERRRSLAALHPFGWAAIGVGVAWDAVRRRPARTAAASATAVAALAVAGLVVVRTPAEPVARPSSAEVEAPASSLVISGQPALPRSDSKPVPVGPATATDVPVQSVPADEGFWVGTGPNQRIWVQLEGSAESALTVTAGRRVSFTGRAVRLLPGHARRVGLSASEGSMELDDTGVYLTVRVQDLVLRDP